MFSLVVNILVCLTFLKRNMIYFSKFSSFRIHGRTDHDPGYEEMLEASVELRELQASVAACCRATLESQRLGEAEVFCPKDRFELYNKNL